MKLNWRLPSRSKRGNAAVKLAVSMLLVGLAFRLLFSRSEELPPGVANPVAKKSVTAKPAESDEASPRFDPTSAEDGNAGAGSVSCCCRFVFFVGLYQFSFPVV